MKNLLKMLDKFFLLCYNKGTKNKREVNKMANKDIIKEMVAQWEQEHADLWVYYEIGC